MAETHSELEMALMELDRAVSGLAKQAEGVKKTIASAKRSPSGRKNGQPDLFAMLSAPGATAAAEGFTLDSIERKLDATIAQIEDLLSEDMQVAGHG